jgi:hypothetical protein
MWKIVKILKFAVFGAAFVAAFGFITMHLWNALVPDLFRGPVVNFWQAAGLIVLSHILFRGGGFKHGWHHRRWHGMREKLAAMTPEQREKFMEKWGSHGMWGCCPYHHEKPTEAKAES